MQVPPILYLALPALAAAAFLWCAGVCARRTLDPRSRTLRPAGADTPPRWSPLRAGTVCLLAALVWQGVFWAAALARSPGAGPSAALQALLYGNTDARHYVDLARWGYGAGEAFPEQYLMIVFFPLFPALLRLLNPLGVLDWYILAFVVQVPLFALAGAALYRVWSRHFGHRRALWALAFLCTGPGSLFFFAPMTESLFLLLTALYVLLLEEKRWALCGAVGLLAGLCRAPGGLLCGVAGIWLIGRAVRRRPAPGAGALWAVAGPPAGLGLYFALNWYVYGEPFRYAVYQKEHWHQGLGLFTDTVAYHLRYFARWWASDRAAAVWISLAALAAIFVTLAALCAGARRLPPHLLAYALAYFALTAGATWAISLPRYFSACLALPALPALCLGRTWQRAAALGLWTALGAAYTAAYFSGAPIY